MIVYKKRESPEELQILDDLVHRSQADTKTLQHYRSLKSGYEGEMQFDRQIANLDTEAYQLNDLLLKFNETHFQIDSLLITEKKSTYTKSKTIKANSFIKPTNSISSPKGMSSIRFTSSVE